MDQKTIQKYFGEFSQAFACNFYNSKSNTFIRLTEQKHLTNLNESLSNQYKYLQSHVEEGINMIPNNFLDDVIDTYIDVIENSDVKLLSCSKGKILSDIQTRMANKLMLIEHIHIILKKLDSKTPFYSKVKDLYDLRTDYYKFEDAYENLLPSDKRFIISQLETHVDPAYSDFYVYAIPIQIQRDLENHNIKMTCTFSSKSCTGSGARYLINIKSPEKKKVDFRRGARFACITEFKTGETINIDPAKHNPLRKVQYDMKESQHVRIVDRVMWLCKFITKTCNPNTAIGAKLLSIMAKPLDLHIFESSKVKEIDWFTRMKVNLRLNNGATLDEDDYKVINRYIGPREINSAYSIVGTTVINKIVMYRKEELDKLLIHEFFHILQVDYALVNKKMQNFFKENLKYVNFCKLGTTCNHNKTFNDESVMMLNEGYVDFCTDIINLLLYAIDIEYRETKAKNEKPNKERIKKLYMEMVAIELNFSAFQVAKILVYLNFNMYEDIYNPNIKENINAFLGGPFFQDTKLKNSGGKMSSNMIRQTTNLYSYFIIRMTLLLNLPRVFQCLNAFNELNSYQNILEYIHVEDKLEGVHKLIVECLLPTPETEKNYELINTYVQMLNSMQLDFVNKKCLQRSDNVELEEALICSMRRSILEMKN